VCFKEIPKRRILNQSFKDVQIKVVALNLQLGWQAGQRREWRFTYTQRRSLCIATWGVTVAFCQARNRRLFRASWM